LDSEDRSGTIELAMAQRDQTDFFAFTTDQVARLTGLSKRQLSHWRRTGFLGPSFEGGTAFYSFRDLVGLRTVAMLRREGVPLQELRKIGVWLEEKHESPWASMKFFLCGKTVYVDDPRTGARESRRPGKQLAIKAFPMKAIVAETRTAIASDRKRPSSTLGNVEKRRGVLGSQNVVAGTRVRTAAIWDLHQAGYSPEQILQEYDSLEPSDIQAALSYEKAKRRAG
jgi:uncharacterized protein (DUF433 family)/DNA-binding transcriptional MerR regulator